MVLERALEVQLKCSQVEEKGPIQCPGIWRLFQKVFGRRWVGFSEFAL